MTDPLPLNGPAVEPTSGEEPKQLVVFLHGYGADGNDLIGLAPYFAEVLPDARFLAPNAPFRCEMSPFGHQWFSLAQWSTEAFWEGAQRVRPMLDAYLDRELNRAGLDDSALLLVGFSQGTMMGLHVGPRRKGAVAGIIGYSGLMIAPERLAEDIGNKPPVLLIHGDADGVVPVQMTPAAARALETYGFDVKTLICEGTAHSIDEQGLAAGIGFAKSLFRK